MSLLALAHCDEVDTSLPSCSFDDFEFTGPVYNNLEVVELQADSEGGDGELVFEIPRNDSKGNGIDSMRDLKALVYFDAHASATFINCDVISASLSVSVGTTKIHLETIYEKNESLHGHRLVQESRLFEDGKYWDVVVVPLRFSCVETKIGYPFIAMQFAKTFLHLNLKPLGSAPRKVKLSRKHL